MDKLFNCLTTYTGKIMSYNSKLRPHFLNLWLTWALYSPPPILSRVCLDSKHSDWNIRIPELFTLPHLFWAESIWILSILIRTLGFRAEFTRNFFGRSFCQMCIPRKFGRPKTSWEKFRRYVFWHILTSWIRIWRPFVPENSQSRDIKVVMFVCLQLYLHWQNHQLQFKTSATFLNWWLTCSPAWLSTLVKSSVTMATFLNLWLSYSTA